MNRLMKLRNEAFTRDKFRINPANIYPPTPPPLKKSSKFLNQIWDFHKNDLGKLKKHGILVKNGEISSLISNTISNFHIVSYYLLCFKWRIRAC